MLASTYPYLSFFLFTWLNPFDYSTHEKIKGELFGGVGKRVYLCTSINKTEAVMTIREMKNDAVRRISLLDEKDTKTVKSIWLYIANAVVKTRSFHFG